MYFSRLVAVLTVLALPAGVRAGLYYSGEPIAELPSQWRGFLIDQRALRNLAVKPTAGAPAIALREQYTEAFAKLEKIGRAHV